MIMRLVEIYGSDISFDVTGSVKAVLNIGDNDVFETMSQLIQNIENGGRI